MTREKYDFPDNIVSSGSVEEKLLHQVDKTRLPRHIAVIMDGNGRWAKNRSLPRNFGHREGVKSVRNIVENSARLGIEVLTIFAFSVENWKRPKKEIDALMKMLSEFLHKEIPRLQKNNISFRPIGRWQELPDQTVKDIEIAQRETAGGNSLLFQVALNYGGRIEIVDACRKLLEECVVCKFNPSKIDEKMIADKLYSPDIPEPDLLIRTSGEFRISNFLLWEIAYTEIYVTKVLWPDFRLKHLLEALIDYQSRDRRYGGLNGDTQ